jgi:phage/plasmid-like protein (TIGR03299 family)
MAHNLSFQKNETGDFVSKNIKPWHGFGTILEQVNLQDAMQYGGLDYHVEKSPNIHRMGEIEIISESSFFTWRTDTHKVLGTVGSRYTPVQNADALAIVNQFPFHIETAGVLKDGAISFVSMKSDKQVVVKGTDVTDMYLLFTNSFDGTSPISVIFTPIRVVCNNTLTAALRGAKEKYTFRHTQSANEKIREFVKVMGLLEKNVTILGDAFNQMSDIQINPVDFFGHVFLTGEEIEALALGQILDAEGDSIISTRKRNIITSALSYYESGPGQKEFKGTGWGAFNGVTGFLGTKDFDSPEDQMLSTVLNLGYQGTTEKAAQLALSRNITPIKGLELALFN